VARAYVFFIVLTLAVGALVAAVRAGRADQPAADLVILDARVVTVDERVPEAQALAVTGDRITAVGTSADIRRHAGPSTEIVDAGGRLVLPGFIESHGHFSGVGEAQLNLDLTQATSWDDIVAMVGEAARAARPGEWIHGRGWHQEKWSAAPAGAVEGFPTHASLDAVSPDNPVVLVHASGHATFVNGKALAVSGITRQTRNPDGGEILRDASGDPTGLLREKAAGLIREDAGTPQQQAARARKALELADREALSKGVTTFVDAGTGFETIDLMKAMVDEGALGVRLWVMVRAGNEAEAKNLDAYRMIDYGGGHLTVRAIKRQIDGALGSRGAWLLEPYADKPDSTGLNTTSIESLEETARLAIAHGYQFCVHAIGDRANRETLDIFERAFKANPGRTDLRWRVEHAQHLDPADIPRFGQLGVIASMQGIHCTSDAPYVPARLGDARAAAGAYVWQKLMASGAVIANGTDAPVEDVDPIANFYATVTRRTKDGAVFYPDQRMTRMEALKSYTVNGAYAAFEEENRGSIAAGKYADVVMLSGDILTVPDDEIRSSEVVLTMVGGKVRYRKP
jgi:predicted amidohydrolase YtcJ